jgi:heparanase 1
MDRAEISQDHGFFKQYLQTLQSAKVPLAGITYHEYVGVMDDASTLNGINLPDLAVNPKQYGALDIAVRNHQILAERRDKFAPGVEIWGGEVANKNRGGGGWGQTFGTALWYFDAIGLKATLGQTLFFRQDLFGASYGLLNSTTLEPTPSYFVALLGKKLLGRRVLKTTLGEGHTLNKSLRTYAFCNRFTTGGISLLLVNVSKKDVVVNVRVAVENDEKGTLQNRHEDYYFTPATGSLSSEVTLMNGKPLALDSSKKVPEWISEAKGSPSKSEHITVKGSSFAIVTLYDANAKACLEF